VTAVPGALPPEAADLLALVARALDDQQAWAHARTPARPDGDLDRYREWLARRAFLVHVAITTDVRAYAGADGTRVAGESAHWLRLALDRHDADHPAAGGTAEVVGERSP